VFDKLQFVGHFLAAFLLTFQVVYSSAITPPFKDSHTLAEASNGKTSSSATPRKKDELLNGVKR
jgi:hypothetical protein